ncbi:MAG: DNA polymerase III subunit gamma/tau [Candidatus Tectomicrobia bacterium]|uniref:DNA polymerase III subunit gamma/tau n=1 Tax=Tectimicrobiota bacterium TaxID=2528274 RepID=A0A932I048_UNCTE|nr:DNA polymerase III subunit gamma/tau [Candidatus Tectomicrobia bacterium]
MAFIGSARKWRPQRFEELIGQDHVRRTLSNGLAAGRVAAAYLFSGTRGVGKTTTARILAKALNCESSDKPVPEPCNACGSCQEIARGAHPDILEIDGATYRGIDNVRELQEKLQFRPLRGRYKVIIIDEVHQITGPAFNALLKTVEEPPPHVAFIFATTELQKVPDTILSRCQVFEFRRISLGQVAAQLARIVKEQKIKAEEGALRLIARMGEGSMRDAQSILDQALAYSGEGTLTAQAAEEVLGVPSSEVYQSIASAVAARDARAALAGLAGIFEAGHDLRFFCANLLEFLRDCMVLQAAGEGEELFDAGPEEMEARREIAGRLSFAETHQAYAILQRAEAELRGSDHPRMTLELALLRMCQIEPLADLGRLMERLESLVPGGAARPQAPPPPPPPPAFRAEESRPPAPAAGPEPHPAPGGADAPARAPRERAAAVASPEWDPAEARRIWGEAVDSLKPARQVLFKGAQLEFEGPGRLRLRVAPANGHAQTIDLVRDTLPLIEAHFARHAPWPVRIAVEAPSPVAPAAEPARDDARRKEEQAAIQEVVDLFNGQIVDDRPYRGRRAGVPRAAEDFQGED